LKTTADEAPGSRRTEAGTGKTCDEETEAGSEKETEAEEAEEEEQEETVTSSWSERTAEVPLW